MDLPRKPSHRSVPLPVFLTIFLIIVLINFLIIFLLIMITMMLFRWTSRENLLTAAGDEDGDPQLFVSLYDFQVFF